jgi:N-acylneuraminate cytidylyltransferase
MIQGKSILALIPARGGSKGIPRKNIQVLAGKPLVAWTIEEAKKSEYIDRLVISSEDEEILRIAEEWGCEVPFVRPADLARDDASSVDVVLHAVKKLPGYDYVVLLQPTSPFRMVEDIDGCIAYCIRHGAKSCTSITVSEKHPSWMYTRDKDGKLLPLIDPAGKKTTRRQDLPVVYVLNGAVYVADCAWFEADKTLIDHNTIGYEMDLESSLDIDYPYQFHVADLLLREQG